MTAIVKQREVALLGHNISREGVFPYHIVYPDTIGVNKVMSIPILQLQLQLPGRFATINHKDGDASNNRADNLEWSAYHYNDTFWSRSDPAWTTPEKCRHLQLE